MSTPNPTHIIADAIAAAVLSAPGAVAEHVVSKLTDAGYSIVPVTKVVGECEDKYPLSDPPLLCQRVSGHPAAHEGVDASDDRFVWPNLAAAEGEKA